MINFRVNNLDKMISEFKMAIIGCGDSTPGKGGTHSIGYAHAWACNACKATKLVAVADVVKKNADDFVAEFYSEHGRSMTDQEYVQFWKKCREFVVEMVVG